MDITTLIVLVVLVGLLVWLLTYRHIPEPWGTFFVVILAIILLVAILQTLGLIRLRMGDSIIPQERLILGGFTAVEGHSVPLV